VEFVLGLGIAWLVVAGLALAVVTGALALTRRRWSGPLLVALWGLDAGLVLGLALLSAMMLPIVAYSLFETLLLLPGSGGGWITWEFQPEAPAAIVASLLGGGWLVIASVATLLAGLRQSIPARIWVLLTLLGGLLVLPAVVIVYLGSPAYLLGWLFGAVGAGCELALALLLALMSTGYSE
jgi:hypothetical protein